MKKPIVIFSVIVLFGIVGATAYLFLTKKIGQKEEVAVSKQQFSNGDGYIFFESGVFSMNYPNWTKINYDTSAPDADKIKIAVSNNAGCNFFLKVKELPENESLQIYTDRVIEGMGDRLKILGNEVKEDRAFLDGEISVAEDVFMRNVSHVFKSGNVIYSAAFVAEKNIFTNACQPILNESVESVKLK